MGLPIEFGLISKIIETGDIAYVKDMQIGLDFFNGDSKSAFRFIQEQMMNTGSVPTPRVFKQRFPSFPLETRKVDGEEIIGTDETIEFWVEEIRKKKKHDTMVDNLEEVAAVLNDFDTETAYNKIKKMITYIERDVEKTEDVDITKGTDKRKEAYLSRKENKGIVGLPSGIPLLDYMTKGFKDETLTTLIAQTSVGKTWIEIMVGTACMLEGKRVLQFVTEMSEDIMRDRYEAMLFGKIYGDFDYKKFKSGALDKETEEQFFRFLEEDLPELDSLYIATATGVMNMEATIEKYWPVDIVLVDGVYLMDDDHSAEQDWLRITHITHDIKKLAKRKKIPIFINTQADKNTSKRVGPELGDISFSQAIGHDSDEIFALYRDDVMRADNETCIKLIKQREGTLGKIMINWDFSRMNFDGIYREEENGTIEENDDSNDEPVIDDEILVPPR